MTTWDDLAAAALLGTQRRPVDVTTLPGPLGETARHIDASDPARALLDAAALAAPYRRAGRRLAAFGGSAPAPAPPERTPAVRGPAATRLAGLLAPAAQPGSRPLLDEWLAAAAGRHVPAETLPVLLDAAARDAQLAAAVAAVLGERGRWLAAFRPEWQRVVAANAAAAAPVTDPAAWETGDPATRRGLFAQLRRTDPAAAAALLAASWRTETGEDREAFLDLMADGLSAADEALLETALDDRRKGVRDRAARLLQRLPRSAYGARTAQRARAAVRLERRLLRTRVVVTPPAEVTKDMLRDGIAAKPPAGTGEQAWWLQGLVGATPLAVWAEITDLSPEQLLAAPVDGGWRDVLVTGWYAATLAQRDTRWAGALLDAGDEWAPGLVALAEPAHRAAYVADALRRRPAQEVNQLLANTPAPWPDVVADAILAWLAKPGPSPLDWAVRGRLDLAAYRLPPRRAADVRALAARRAEDDPWQAALLRLADLLAYRHDMLEELR